MDDELSQQDESQLETQQSSFVLEEIMDNNLLSSSPARRPNATVDSQPGSSCTPSDSTYKRKRPYSQERQSVSSPFQPGPSSTLTSSDTNNTANKRKRLFPQQRRCAPSPFDVEMLNALKGMQQAQHQQQKQITDDDEQFLLSLLPVMKSLDTISKLELRGELNATAPPEP